MRVLVKTLVGVASEIGMKINREKSVVIIFNSEERIEKIEEIKVDNTMKYLGVMVKNVRDSFKIHKEKKIKTAKLFSNLTYSVIQKSCNKLTIGKAYWESVVVPAVMYGTTLVTWNKTELDELQREENKVWRFILGGPGYVTVTAMRGEMGATTVRIRDMKAKLKYVRGVMRGRTGNLTKTVMTDMFERGGDKLVKVVKNYMSDIGISDLDQLEGLSEFELNKRIKVMDENKWRNEMIEQTTMEIYRQYKNNLRLEIIYNNTYESVLLFRARSNSLNLGWRERFSGGSGLCKVCGGCQVENLVHFLLECSAYDYDRSSCNAWKKYSRNSSICGGD